jgi:hypothetical protein
VALPVIRPRTAVISGSAGLAVSLAAASERLGAPRPPGRIKEVLAEGAGAFGPLLDDLLALARRRLVAIDEMQADPAVILPLDQAEELFNPDGVAEAEAFLDLLSRVLAPAAERPRKMLIVATMRSDRYELLQNAPHLANVKRDLFDLPPISQAEFKSVIEGPARRAVESGGRLAIAPALTERVMADAQGADALPLLGFTLERLYADYGSAGTLTTAEYDRLGGVQGSIAEAVANALAEPGRSPAIPAEKDAQLTALRAAFIPWLARIDPETGAPMQRAAHRNEIPLASRAVVERLVDARLLVADRRTGTDVIEVAHESLLRQWPALTAWLDADADDLKLIEGVLRAAAEWFRNGRLEAWFDHRANRLRAAELLVARDAFRKRIGEEGTAYLIACREREETERQEKKKAIARRAQLQRIARWALTTAAVVLVFGIAAVLWQQVRLNARKLALEQGHVNLLAELAAVERARGNLDGALRLAVRGAGLGLVQRAVRPGLAAAELSAIVTQLGWRLALNGNGSPMRTAALSPDGSQVVTTSKDGAVRIWDGTKGDEITSIGRDDGYTSAAYSPDGSRIVMASDDHTARIWDAVTLRQIAVLRGHESAVSSATFSPDGSRIVTASEDGTVRIWDVATANEIAVLRRQEHFAFAAFSPDGSHIVSTSADDRARIWEAVTGKEVTVLQLKDSVSAVSFRPFEFSPDGARIVSTSIDNTARVWEAATGKEIAALRGHEDRMRSAAFSPDGSLIIAASDDRTVRFGTPPPQRKLRCCVGTKVR